MEPKERGETAEVNAEEIVTIYFVPRNSMAAVRAAAEIKTRLEGRLHASVEPRRDRVPVRTTVKPQHEAEAVRETVADVAFIVLLRLTQSIAASLAVGLGWGALPKGLAWSLADLVAPNWTISLRRKFAISVVDGDAIRQLIWSRLESRSKALNDRSSRSDLRLLGASTLAFWLVWVALLIWLPSRLASL
jgi:hypothetical protein